jgi:phosphoesterase RecJ-like protein
MFEQENSKYFSSAVRLFKKSKKLIITSHRNPDGDAIGSCLAMYHFAKTLGKSAEIILTDKIPYNYQFLTGAEQIKEYDKDRDYFSFLSADLIVILDLNESRRLHRMEDVIVSSRAGKLVFDHHEGMHLFANEVISMPQACSTAEIIYRFIANFDDYTIDKPVAEAIYSGIMTDTGSFRFPRTTGDVHRMIGDLIDHGADPVEIYEQTYNQNRIGGVHILGEALKSITLHHGGKLSIMTITSAMLDNCGVTNADIDNFAEKTLSIENTIAGVMISELESNRDEIRVSLRSKGNFSIRDVAMEMGGGGHFNASGARIFNKSIYEAKNEIIEIIGRHLQKDGR